PPLRSLQRPSLPTVGTRTLRVCLPSHPPGLASASTPVLVRRAQPTPLAAAAQSLECANPPCSAEYDPVPHPPVPPKRRPSTTDLRPGAASVARSWPAGSGSATHT